MTRSFPARIAVVLVLALIAVLAQTLPTFAPPASAAITDVTVATWNMQGGTAKWSNPDDLPHLLDRYHVVALQEHPDTVPPGMVQTDVKFVRPGFDTDTPGWNDDADGAFRVVTYQWTHPRNGRVYYVYYLETPRNGRALVTVSDRAAAAVGVLPAVGGVANPRPAFGIRRDDAWFYNIHADSPRGPDAPGLVQAVANKYPGPAASWTVMGDFNREPDTLPLGLGGPGTQIIDSGLPTYEVPNPESEYDYMVAHGLQAGHQYAARRLTYMESSDHYPVSFAVDPRGRGQVCNRPGPPVPVLAPVVPRSAPASEAGADTAGSTSAVGCAPTRPAAIVSLGDSYISGEGGRWAGNALTGPEGDVWGTDRRSRCQAGKDCVYDATSYDFNGNRCDRSDVAPIKGMEYADVPPERRFNLACSGATTKNILSDGFKGEKPQVEQLADLAAVYDIRLVVVSIGGNDLDFSGIVANCGVAYFVADSTLKQPCSRAKEDEFAGRLNTVRAEIVKTLTAVRATMLQARQSNYELVLQSYPNVLPGKNALRYGEGQTSEGGTVDRSRYVTGGCPFLKVDADWAHTSVVPRISEMLRQAAGMTWARFLDVQNAFAGHELCADTAQQATSANGNGAPLPADKAEWVRWVPYLPGWEKWATMRQGDAQEAIHPNAFGQQALSRCLTEFGRAVSGSKEYIFTCAGSGDGMAVTPDASARREGIVILRNTRTDEVLDDEGKASGSYLLTNPYLGKPSQRWLLHNVGSKISLQSQRNGGFLDRGRASTWTYLADAEAGWTVVPTDDGKVRLTIGDSAKCLTQDPGRDTSEGKWVSVFGCSEDRMKDMQTWKIEYQEGIVFTPADGDTAATNPREGQQMELRSGTGMAVDLSGGDTTAGTSVQAREPTGGPAQRWVTRSLGGGSWRLAAATAPGMVVDHDPGPHTTHLVEVQEGNANQVWQAKGTGTGWYTLVSAADGGCLTAGAAGAALVVAACAADSKAQQWKFLDAGTGTETGTIRGLGDKCVEPRGGTRDDRTPVRLADCAGSDGQAWTVAADGSLQSLAKCLDVDGGRTGNGTPVQLYTCNASPAQRWIYTARQELKNPNSGRCLTVPGSDTTRQLEISDCAASPAQQWRLAARPVGTPGGSDAGDPFDAAPDDRGGKPTAAGDCRPEGMTPTAGVSARYCDVYDGAGREWVGNGRTRRVVGYFTGWRAGADGDPKYLVSNIPWSKVSHVNYAFAKVQDNRISIGDPNDPANPATGMTWPGEKNAMDPSLPYKGHFNLLNTYKKKHPAVKTLISVGGWADTRNFHTMTTNADGSVNQPGIDAFADSVTAFLDRYGFNGVDIDYEYPTALPDTGNPLDWDVSNPRRKGLQQGYNALMKTLRERLDRAGADKGRYYLLTSAGSASGYLVRGLDAGQALQYQDYVNVMSYDLHGSWNKFVGPQAPLYDDGRDNELADAGIYDDQAPNTKDFQKTGYFNTDWAYHYYRGALPAGRINLGIPYYSRGWRDVRGGTDGLWGTAAMPDQSQCPLGTGGRGPANAQSCGLGAVGIDNVWHDLENGREVGAGSNPLWHTRNLQDGRTPGYLRSYGVDTNLPSGQLTGGYAEKYSDALQASWLWNDSKKVFLSTENEKSIDAKAKYIVDKGIGGAMIWELAGDYARRPGGEWGMGYDLTTRLDDALKGAGAAGNTKAGGRPQPAEVIDVKAELVEFPTGKDDFYPVQPKLRITNDSGVTLAQGTEITFDLPTSTPPVVKDNDYKPLKGLVPGHTGPNAGGLKGDFHRLTITLGYCEDLAPGKSRDIDLKYYLPVTGPSNVTFRIGGREFGSTGDRRRDVRTVTPPAPGEGSSCQAPDWRPGQVYRPDGGRLWRMYDKGDKGWQFEYGDSPAGKPMMIDNYPDQSRAHLVEAMEQNPNQYWRVQPAGGGLYTVGSGGRCLTATAARQDLASLPCDGRNEQKWKLVPIADNGSEGAPGAPRHNGLFKLRSAGGNDIEVAGGATTRGTHLLTGDPAASTAAFVKYQGFYWYAQWYTTVAPGTAEANGGRPWKKLSPAP